MLFLEAGACEDDSSMAKSARRPIAMKNSKLMRSIACAFHVDSCLIDHEQLLCVLFGFSPDLRNGILGWAAPAALCPLNPMDAIS